jgi:predicted glutamine amidotransferase
MCRLMGYVSPKETTVAEITGANFDQFAQLSTVHKDGWGIATLDSHKASALIQEPISAITSTTFADSAANLESDGALLHFRWATPGLAINDGNTHPFSFEGYSFIHNGAITPPESLDPFIDSDLGDLRRGDTDSERYFYLLISNIRKSGLVAGVIEGVRQIRTHCTFSSLNAMILTPDHYLVICEHDNSRIPSQFGPDYYELFFRNDKNGVLVASSGWDQHDWTSLSNHRLLVVNRETFDVEITEI